MDQDFEYTYCKYCGRRISYAESYKDERGEYCSEEHMKASEHVHHRDKDRKHKHDFVDDGM